MTALITNENYHEFRAIAASAALSAQNNTGQRDDGMVDDQISVAIIKIIEKFDRVGDENVYNPIGLAWSVAYNAVRDEIKMRTLWGKGRSKYRREVSLDSDFNGTRGKRTTGVGGKPANGVLDEDEDVESALWRRVSSAYFFDFSPYDEVDARVSIPRLLELLAPQEVYVITRLFFYRDKQEAVAEALGFDQSAISHIKSRALRKMRRAFERDGTI